MIFFIFTARCWEVYRHRKALPLPEVAFWSQQWQWQKVCHRHTLYSSFPLWPLIFFMSHTHMAALLWLSLHYWHCCLIACQKIQVAIRRLLRAQTQFRLLDCKKKKKCKRFLLCDIFGGSLVTGEFFFSSYEIIIHFSAVWLIIIMKQTTDKCRLLLYLAVCVSFVSPYLFITPTPQFCPFGLRMRGGPPLLDYGIKVSVLTRNDAYKSKTLPHQVYFSHVLISVIRVPCHLAVLNRCMHSTGYGIT